MIVAGKELEPIRFGHGRVGLEVFVEPTCPFCAKTFKKLQPLVDAVGADALTVEIRFVSQPWHLFSAVVTRCILAASVVGGREAGIKVMSAIMEEREEFVCEGHCAGPNTHNSPASVIARVSELSEMDLREAFEIRDLEKAIKWHAKYSRQNGIHVSPTFVVDGLINDGFSSGQTVEEWAGLLGLDAK